jgi:hypothetical protein
MRVISRLKGGLGNQLFQLAFLDLFCVSGNLRGGLSSEYFSSGPDEFGRTIYRDLVKFLGLEIYDECISTTPILINDNFLGLFNNKDRVEFSLDDGMLEHDIILDGYFQDRRVIRESFINKVFEFFQESGIDNPSEKNIIHRVRKENSVSVHIRRFDYFHHGVADINYYLDSILAIKELDPESKFYIFSDEPNSVEYIIKKNWSSTLCLHRKSEPSREVDCSIDDLNFVNSGRLNFDFRVMMLCKSHVISNSTLSWWAATISNSDLVVYPTPWSRAHVPSSYLLSPKWLSVPNSVRSFEREISYYEHIRNALNQKVQQ